MRKTHRHAGGYRSLDCLILTNDSRWTVARSEIPKPLSSKGEFICLGSVRPGYGRVPMALGVDLLTDLPHPSCDPDRWTIQALLDELERRQEPESRHKLKPTKLAGKSLSELAVEARRRAEAKAALDKACTKHWSRCAPCSPYPSPVCRTHSDMRASFQFPDPRELRLRVSR